MEGNTERPLTTTRMWFKMCVRTVIPVCGRLRQEEQDFQASLGSTERIYFKITPPPHHKWGLRPPQLLGDTSVRSQPPLHFQAPEESGPFSPYTLISSWHAEHPNRPSVPWLEQATFCPSWIFPLPGMLLCGYLLWGNLPVIQMRVDIRVLFLFLGPGFPPLCLVLGLRLLS